MGRHFKMNKLVLTFTIIASLCFLASCGTIEKKDPRCQKDVYPSFDKCDSKGKERCIWDKVMKACSCTNEGYCHDEGLDFNDADIATNIVVVLSNWNNGN